jgi:hypothetical protein
MMFPDPVEDEAVGGQQAQDIAFFLSVQGADPGAELLFGQLAFQALQAVFPQGVVHSVILLWGPRRWVTGDAMPVENFNILTFGWIAAPVRG